MQDMIFVSGGTFVMGSNSHYPEEAPAHSRTVESFWIDETPVTNAAFAKFVGATGYITQAEIAPDEMSYPDMDPTMAVPASAVFTQPREGDSVASLSWWQLVPGSDWRHPLGLGSSIDGLEDHPVVHVGYQDALTYANWAGKTLPTEEQWEFAARGGLQDTVFAWGDEFEPDGVPQANYWQGQFPFHNSLKDGYALTSPVRHFPPNKYGLFDMIGNVWEWTSTPYEQHHQAGSSCCCSATTSTTPTASSGALSGIPVMVLKGGSHLCAENYCQRYRPAARHPQPVDTTTSHVGFRCIAFGPWLMCR